VGVLRAQALSTRIAFPVAGIPAASSALCFQFVGHDAICPS
jgi:hypothetical protein